MEWQESFISCLFVCSQANFPAQQGLWSSLACLRVTTACRTRECVFGCAVNEHARRIKKGTVRIHIGRFFCIYYRGGKSRRAGYTSATYLKRHSQRGENKQAGLFYMELCGLPLW